MVKPMVLTNNTLNFLNQEIIEVETSEEDCEDIIGIGYLLNRMLEVLPSKVRSLSFGCVKVCRQGTQDWTFGMAVRYISRHYL